MVTDLPAGWPGMKVIEGRTISQVPDKQIPTRGPAPRDGSGFLNLAMSGSRTRSVLLLKDALEHGWLRSGDGPIHIIDSLASTGMRARRWMNEIPSQSGSRLRLTINDLDAEALSWARGNSRDIEFHGEVQFTQNDARVAILESGWHWIDIDPFGSPVPFLDVAFQSCARRAVIDVCATDTAALTGSTTTSGRRRYGSLAKVDDLRHDTAMRILLGNLASTAARHDRVIEPILTVFDDHHIRATVLVRRSRKDASAFHEQIGWRVHHPTTEEVISAMEAGLEPEDDADISRLSCLLPHHSPPVLDEKRVSGPLWIGRLGDPDIVSRLTEDSALETCWDSSMDENSRRSVISSVRGLAESASTLDCRVVVPVDEIPRFTSIPGPPSPRVLSQVLRKEGFLASPAALMVPAIRTNAPWSRVLDASQRIMNGHSN